MTTASRSRRSRQNPAIREFILTHVDGHPDTVGTLAAKEFGLSRTAVSRYMQRLVNEGLMAAEGKTNARRYKLSTISKNVAKLEIKPGMLENDVWREHILPHIKNAPENVIDVCQYGFTEMFNNVIDHSQSKEAVASYEQTYTTMKMIVIDYGIGIFEKIQRDFKLNDPRTALLELSKGKLTSDQARHSGEGIFFTSRMFDEFLLRSGNLFYSRKRQDDWGWLIGTEDVVEYRHGTTVTMTISTSASWTAKEIFERYQDDDYRFAKTHVPISLGKYPGEQLVSRSQAKRILSRVNRFSEVFLDFQGVQQIGQAFADEIFRVFHREHPDIRLTTINTSPDVDRMVAHVQATDGLASPPSV